MEMISPLDGMFLIGESREHPMHVGGLHVYKPPPGAGPDFVRELYQELITDTDATAAQKDANSDGINDWDDNVLSYEPVRPNP